VRYSEGNIGRVFVIRLEDGDRFPEVVERKPQQVVYVLELKHGK